MLLGQLRWWHVVLPDMSLETPPDDERGNIRLSR